MKKVEILIGSPRKNGNSFILSNHLNDLLNYHGAHSSMSFLYDFDIKPCIDCRACKKNDFICTLKDDTYILFNKIESSDIIIIGTPIYWYGPTAKTKLLIDRFRPYFVNKKLNGKKGAIILPAGTGAPDCDLTIEMFKRVFASLGIEYLEGVTAEAYDVGDVVKNESALEEIRILSEIILKSN